MAERLADVLPASYRACFGCGEDNHAGINLADLARDADGDVVRATLRPQVHHQGFPGVLHGGIASAALDEAMSYACVFNAGIWVATAKMELRFRRPLPVEGEILVEAGVVEGSSNRRFHTWGKLIDRTGNVCVEATALFLPAPGDLFERL